MIRFALGLLTLVLMIFIPLPVAFRVTFLIFGAALGVEGGLLLIRGNVMVEELYKDPFWKYFFGFTAERRALGGSAVLAGLFTLGANLWLSLIVLLIGGALIASEFFFPFDERVAPYFTRIGNFLESIIQSR